MNETNEIPKEQISEKQTNEEQITQNATNYQAKEELPMNWYNFFIYFRLPIGIFANGIALLTAVATGDIITFVVDIVWIAFLAFLMYSMIKRKKDTYIYIMLDLVINAILQFCNKIAGQESDTALVIGTLLGIGLFIYPNYVYFTKRKHIFIN